MHPARSTSVDVSSPVQQFVCYPAMSPGNQLRILHLAATTMEATVDSALSLLLEAGQPFDYAQVRDLALPQSSCAQNRASNGPLADYSTRALPTCRETWRVSTLITGRVRAKSRLTLIGIAENPAASFRIDPSLRSGVVFGVAVTTVIFHSNPPFRSWIFLFVQGSNPTLLFLGYQFRSAPGTCRGSGDRSDTPSPTAGPACGARGPTSSSP